MRNSRHGTVSCMDPTSRHQAAEARFRQLLRDAELAEPDRVQYATEEMTFFWDGPKVAVVVQLAPPAGSRRAARRRERPLRSGPGRQGRTHRDPSARVVKRRAVAADAAVAERERTVLDDELVCDELLTLARMPRDHARDRLRAVIAGADAHADAVADPQSLATARVVDLDL